MPEERSGSSLLTKIFAVVVLLIVGWLALKFVIGLVTGLVWLIVGIAAVLAVIWAVFALRD